MKRLVSLMAIAALGLCAAGCSDDEVETPEVKDPVINAPSSINVASDAHQDKITYTIENAVDGASISAVTPADWIGSFDYATAGEVRFDVEANTDDVRTSTVTLSYPGAQSVTVEVIQALTERVVVEQDVYEVDFTAQSISIVVKANATTECSIAEGVDWITPAQNTSALSDKEFRFDIEANDGDAREAVLSFICGTVCETVTVKQAAADLLAKIADEGLREFVKENFDTDGDGMLSASEAEAVTGLEYTAGAATAEGIEIFPNLTTLDLRNSTFATLDLSKNTKLQNITLNYCTSLSSIDLTGCTDIVSLNVGLCSALTSIDLSGMPQLNEFIGYSSGLTSLDTSHNTELTRLTVYSSKIVTLDLSNNAKLTSLNAGQSTLESIDLSNNTALTTVSLEGSSKITSIDLSNNVALMNVTLDNCDLRTLNTDTLSDLLVLSLSGNNNLESLNISKNLQLETLYALCYPGGGDGTYKLYMLRLQEETVNLWVSWAAEKIYVDEEQDDENLADKITNSRLQSYVMSNFDINGDGILTKAEAEAVTSIVCSDVSDPSGIELFPNLEKLSLQWGYFSTIDLSGNPKLTELDLFQCTSLTELDLSGNTALKTVNAQYSKIKTLNTDALTALESLTVSNCLYIETLDISKNTNLSVLNAVCYVGGGDGSWTLKLLHSQDDSVEMSLACCDKVYVD